MQYVYFVDKKCKCELLLQMIGQGNWQQVLVFICIKYGVNYLVEQFNKDGICSVVIYGNKLQGVCICVLVDFKFGDICVLVVMDIVVCGLDIEELLYVVNYELLNVLEDYVYCIGCIGCVVVIGEVLLLVCVDEYKLLCDIEKLLKKEILCIMMLGYELDLLIKVELIQNGCQQCGGGGCGCG